MKKDNGFQDDGRSVADMSGTYDIGLSGFTSLKRFRKKRKEKESGETETKIHEDPLTKWETRKLAVNAMLAGLLVGVVFVVGALLFILFALNVWLK